MNFNFTRKSEKLEMATNTSWTIINFDPCNPLNIHWSPHLTCRSYIPDVTAWGNIPPHTKPLTLAKCFEQQNSHHALFSGTKTTKKEIWASLKIFNCDHLLVWFVLTFKVHDKMTQRGNSQTEIPCVTLSWCFQQEILNNNLRAHILCDGRQSSNLTTQ